MAFNFNAKKEITESLVIAWNGAYKMWESAMTIHTQSNVIESVYDLGSQLLLSTQAHTHTAKYKCLFRNVFAREYMCVCADSFIAVRRRSH